MEGLIVEWAPFRVRTGVTERELIEAAAAMQSDFLEIQDGYVRRELLQGADGLWCDLVYWRDDASAKAAMEQAMENAVCRAYFALMRGVDQEDPGAALLHLRVRRAYGGAEVSAA